MPTPEELSLGTLGITVTSHGNDPAEVKFDLPDGSSVTREIPAEGLLMKLGLGLGLSYVKGAPGAAEYVASAVHFDGSDLITIASVACTDNAFFSFSLWVKTATDQNFLTMWAVDPEGVQEPNYAYRAAGATRWRLADVAFSSELQADTSSLANAAWHHVLATAKCDLGAGLKIVKLYVDRVDVTTNIDDAGSAFNPETNGRAFSFGGVPGEGIVADFADVWIAPGVSLLTGSDIALATLNKFIDTNNKPVYLGSDGSLPTGTAPALFFSGNAAQFATNRGTGGAASTTGTLTNAATSPSD